MPKLQDYRCRTCGADYEFLHHPIAEPAVCPTCGSPDAEIRATGGTLLTTIIPVYPGCKRVKAGYQHTHYADHPAEKISVSVPSNFKGDPK